MTLSGIWLPTSARRKIGECFTCGTEFFEGESETAQRHMGPCARAAHEEGRLQDPTLPIMRWDPDPQVTAHMKKVGKTMLAEGRFVVKPSERAGLS